MDYEQTFFKTSIIPTFGQVKQYFVQQSTNVLIDSIWYDVPRFGKEEFDTYTLGKSDFAMLDLQDEENDMNVGFVNFRYT